MLDYFSKVNLLIYYLILINLISFLAFAIDKSKARRKKWRIPEKTLMLLTVIGGSLGGFIGMYTMRHKTHKKKFTIVIPAVMILHIILIIFTCFIIS